VEQIGGNGSEGLFGLGAEAARDHGADLGFAEILQALCGGAGGELMEVERLVALFEVLVEEVAVGGHLEDGEQAGSMDFFICFFLRAWGDRLGPKAGRWVDRRAGFCRW
jgi:hypothetical protein